MHCYRLGPKQCNAMELSFQRKMCGVFGLVTCCIHPGQAAVPLILTRPVHTLELLYTTFTSLYIFVQNYILNLHLTRPVPTLLLPHTVLLYKIRVLDNIVLYTLISKLATALSNSILYYIRI